MEVTLLPSIGVNKRGSLNLWNRRLWALPMSVEKRSSLAGGAGAGLLTLNSRLAAWKTIPRVTVLSKKLKGMSKGRMFPGASQLICRTKNSEERYVLAKLDFPQQQKGPKKMVATWKASVSQTYRPLPVPKRARIVTVVHSSKSILKSSYNLPKTSSVSLRRSEHLDNIFRALGINDCEHSHEGEEKLENHFCRIGRDHVLLWKS